MQHDDKKGSSTSSKVKKGFLAVQVGLEDEDQDLIYHEINHDDDDDDYVHNNNDYYRKKELQKFVIPIWHLYHPLFIGLLDRAREVYGYHVDGPLRLPCSVDDFIHLCWMIEKENHPGGSHRRHDYHHQLFNHAPSFRSC